MKWSITLLAFGALVACSAPSQYLGEKARATILNNNGKAIGRAVFTQGSQGVLMDIKISGLSAGKHGMHFHAVGNCSDHKHFKMAKGHIMPSGKPHGYLHPEGPHEGNLPNLVVAPNGKVHVELYSELISLYGEPGKPALLDDDGSTLMVHVNEDDHVSQPIGGSGARVACGVIRK